MHFFFFFLNTLIVYSTYDSQICDLGVEGVEPDANKRDYPVTSDQMWWCARDSREGWGAKRGTRATNGITNLSILRFGWLRYPWLYLRIRANEDFQFPGCIVVLFGHERDPRKLRLTRCQYAISDGGLYAPNQKASNDTTKYQDEFIITTFTITRNDKTIVSYYIDRGWLI